MNRLVGDTVVVAIWFQTGRPLGAALLRTPAFALFHLAPQHWFLKAPILPYYPCPSSYPELIAVRPMRDRITGADSLPPLAELVTQAANKLCLGQPCPTPNY